MRVQVQIDNTHKGALMLRPRQIPEQINVQENSTVSVFDSNTSRGYKGFQFSENSTNINTPLDGTYKLYTSEGYPGIITSQVCNASGDFAPAIVLSFYIGQEVPTNLYIIFDLVCKEYAPEIVLRNDRTGEQVVYYNNSPILKIPMTYLYPQPGDQFTIGIRKWSKYSSSAKITKISAYPIPLFAGNDILDMSCSENLLDANISIGPGICEQYADIKVYDRDGILRMLSHDGKLTEDFEVTIKAIDDDNNDTYNLGSYRVDNWDISGTSYEVGIDCRDISYILNEVNIQSIPVQSRTVHRMLQLMFKYIPGTTWKYIDADTMDYCENIRTPYCWFKNGTLYELLQKICVLAMIRIYWHVDCFIVARCW